MSRNYQKVLPLSQIREAILALSKDDAAAEAWCQERIVEDLDEGDWEPRALHELCSWVMSNRPEAKGLRRFAQDAAKVELEILTSHCLEKAGFSTQGSQNA